MITVSVSEFKAKCLSLLARVQETREPLMVTKRGKPLARVFPARDGKRQGWLGLMKGTAEISGNLVEPALPPEAWDADRR